MKEKFKIIVAEPWDFDGPDGENRIMGKIISVVNNKCLVFESNHMLHFKGESGRILILSPRIRCTDFNNIGKQGVDVNGGLLLVEYKEGLSIDELDDNCIFALIGTIYESKYFR